MMTLTAQSKEVSWKVQVLSYCRYSWKKLKNRVINEVERKVSEGQLMAELLKIPIDWFTRMGLL